MVRRRKATKRRRAPKMTSILSLAEGYIQGSILLNGAVGGNTNPVSFIFGGLGGYGGGSGITLQSIISNPQSSLDAIGTRLMDPKTVLDIATKSFLANVGFRFARKALSRNINMVNRLAFKPLALGVKL
jgi:hypothetical protein